MEHIICNPMDLDYRYQLIDGYMGERIFREAADPTMLLFKGTYLLFASKSLGFWYSDDLYSWQFKPTPELPVYDYAPDVREINGAVVFSASRRGQPCSFYRSENPLQEAFKEVSTIFDFWDPAIFQDDDGRVYFYWGCTNTEPLWAIEIDPATLQPIGEKVAVVHENDAAHGWERTGENNQLKEPKTEMEKLVRQHVGTKPFIEGAYMNKYGGKYYLQYAGPGTQYNVYSDGVYVGDGPLGPFTYQAHNPFSSKPGGFIAGAGHGSTFQDKQGNWWHISTMRISVHYDMERRLGLFPCDFDEDGVLYCNQNFADYPLLLPNGEVDCAATQPACMLLSYGKAASASSSAEGHEPALGTNEDVRTWWAAAKNSPAEWYQLDLGEEMDIHAVQLNFADHSPQWPDNLDKEGMVQETLIKRHIEPASQPTEYLLETSRDGTSWEPVKDARGKTEDRPHPFLAFEAPRSARYVRVSGMKLPYGSTPAISGLRVFGFGKGEPPAAVKQVAQQRVSPIDVTLRWPAADGATGYNLRYGTQPDKLYSSWLVYGETQLELGTLTAGTQYYVAVDSFNENGVTAGKIVHIES